MSYFHAISCALCGEYTLYKQLRHMLEKWISDVYVREYSIKSIKNKQEFVVVNHDS